MEGGGKRMREAKSTYVIAEVGVNHDGDLGKAVYLLEQAAQAGADAVKFQTFKTELLVRARQERMPYQVASDGGDRTQFEMLRALELGHREHALLRDRAKALGLDFISTPYDAPSAAFLAALPVDALKIASTDAGNIPLLRQVAGYGLPVIYSTGVSALWEVVKAVEEGLAGLDRRKLTVLHCVSNYPAPQDELNLRVMARFAALFDCAVGFSDHSASLLMGAYAVCAGASVLEKHFTHDKAAAGPDHQASLEPGELREYIARVREAERALGDGVKRVQPSERAIKPHMQKSLTAARALTAGRLLEAGDLSSMRPADGISPLFVDEVVGRRLAVDKAPGDPLFWRDLG